MVQYSDNFPYSDGPLAGNGAWIALTGITSADVFNNHAYGLVGALAAAVYNDTFAAAHFSKALVNGNTLGDNTKQHGVAVRMQSGAMSAYYALNKCDGTIDTGQVVSGSFTGWESNIGGSIADGDFIELAIDENTLTTVYLKVNGTIIRTYTGKSALSGGKGGLFFFGDQSTSWVDNWTGGDVASGGIVAVGSSSGGGIGALALGGAA